MGFLRYDSAFMTACRKAVDFVSLGLLWFLASIPLFTFGAATTAMYYTAEKSIRMDEGRIWATFWFCFRKEFRQAAILWLFGLVLTIFMVVNCSLLWQGQVHRAILVPLLVTSFLIIGWMQLWYGYLARFEDTVWVLLNNTFRIALACLGKLVAMLLICVASVVGAVIAFYCAGPVLFLIPGIYSALTSIMLRKIFHPFMCKKAKIEDENKLDEP